MAPRQEPAQTLCGAGVAGARVGARVRYLSRLEVLRQLGSEDYIGNSDSAAAS